jgi:hypothetical protein
LSLFILSFIFFFILRSSQVTVNLLNLLNLLFCI